MYNAGHEQEEMLQYMPGPHRVMLQQYAANLSKAGNIQVNCVLRNVLFPAPSTSTKGWYDFRGVPVIRPKVQ